MREILCITCPNSCRLQVAESGGDINVTGNLCNRGIIFARTELTHPVRTLTTTVRTIFPESPVLPVRTDGEIPKGKIRELMNLLNTITVRKPLEIGTVVAENVLALGVNVIVSSNVLKE
jgi:CxxC motif-containing protein